MKNSIIVSLAIALVIISVSAVIHVTKREQISEVKVMNILQVVATQEVCHRLGHVKASGKPWFERLSKSDMVSPDGSVKPLKNAYSVLEELVEKSLSRIDTTNILTVNSAANECAMNNVQYKGLDIYVNQ